MSDDLRHEVQVERDRCLAIVETYETRVRGYEAMLITRLGNIIRNGIVPESFVEQMSSDEPTEFCDPVTVEEERQRCLQCIDVHYHDDAPLPVRRMLDDIRRGIQGDA